MEIFKASSQWANRPADERFWDLDEMYQACDGYRRSAVEATVRFGSLRAEADHGEVKLIGKASTPARLTHWSFGQICNRVGAPAGYLRELPATLAVQNINHGFSRLSAEDNMDSTKLMFHKNGDLLLRAATGPAYTRIWNADIVRRLQDNLPEGWRVPPARPAGVDGERKREATDNDVLRLKKSGLSIEIGDLIAPAGLYASDHDCFIFMVNEDTGIDDGTGHGLGRGFFIWNSEVGAASFGVMTFLYDAICGNHIVWGARGVKEIRVRHIGDADGKAFHGLRMELVKYADSSVSDIEAQIKAARSFEFAGPGADKKDVIEAVMSHVLKVRAQVNQKLVGEAYDRAEKAGRYGSPRSAWGIANGLTEISQESGHADERVRIDRAAGKLLEIAF